MQKKSVAIVSDSWAGIVAAAFFERDGYRVDLIETGDNLVVEHRRKDIFFPFVPATDAARTALHNLASLLGVDPNQIELDAPAQTFDGQGMKPFVGFGESKSAAVEMLSRLNSAKKIEATPHIEELLTALKGTLRAKVHNFAELSALEFDGDRVSKLLINGTEEIVADQYLFLNSPRELVGILPHDILGSRTRGRLLKSPVWARVALRVQHSAPVELSGLLYLIPGPADEHPIVGAAAGNQTTWETYIPNDLAEDAEEVAKTLRNMKKLVRRVYPEIDEKAVVTLSISPYAAGDFGWAVGNEELAAIGTNLVVDSVLFGNSCGLVRRVECGVEAYSRAQALAATPAKELSPSLLESCPS